MDQLFLDANVLFTAAHNANGKAAFLFDQSGDGNWQLVTSRYAVEEARRNMAAKYPQHLEKFEQLVTQLTVIPQPAPRPTPIDLPDKDRPIFIAAQVGRASHLLTGDLKHFGPHMNQPEAMDGLIVQTVADYLASL